MERRDLIIKYLTITPIARGVIGSAITLQPAVASLLAPKRGLFKELGLRTFINAADIYTSMTASLMPDEVLQMITSGTREFVMLNEVQDKAVINNTIKKISRVTTEVFAPPVSNPTPILNISWENIKVKVSGKRLQKQMRNGNPSIEVRGGKNDGVILKSGQENIIAKRIKEELLLTSA